MMQLDAFIQWGERYSFATIYPYGAVYISFQKLCQNFRTMMKPIMYNEILVLWYLPLHIVRVRRVGWVRDDEQRVPRRINKERLRMYKQVREVVTT